MLENTYFAFFFSKFKNAFFTFSSNDILKKRRKRYQSFRNKLPVVFSTYFEKNKVIHKYNTRQKDDFHIDAIKSEIGKRSIRYKGSKLWNDLPAELKEIQSLQSFKYKLKNYLLQSLACY